MFKTGRDTTTKFAQDKDNLLKRLRRLERENPALKEAVRMYAAILPLLRSADLDAGPVSLSAREVRAKMEQGLPLLSGVDLDVDAGAVKRLLIALAAAVEPPVGVVRLFGWKGGSKSEAARIRKALETDVLGIADLLPAVTRGDTAAVCTVAGRTGLDPELLTTLVQNALKPALRAWRRQLSPLANGAAWSRGMCFVCVAAATFGELRNNDQEKHLRCGSCGADWRFPRLKCTLCGNEDHETQRYLYTEETKDRMRLEVCDKCKGYVKVISSFTPTAEEFLEVQDLATVHLDRIAEEKGYTRLSRMEKERRSGMVNVSVLQLH